MLLSTGYPITYTPIDVQLTHRKWMQRPVGVLKTRHGDHQPTRKHCNTMHSRSPTAPTCKYNDDTEDMFQVYSIGGAPFTDRAATSCTPAHPSCAPRAPSCTVPAPTPPTWPRPTCPSAPHPLAASPYEHVGTDANNFGSPCTCIPWRTRALYM